MARSWGSTDAEETEYWRLRDKNQPTNALEHRWEDRVDAALKVARRAINRIHEIDYLRTVPIAGVIEPVKPDPIATLKAAAKATKKARANDKTLAYAKVKSKGKLA